MQKKPLSEFHPGLTEAVMKEFLEKFKADLTGYVDLTLFYTGDFHDVWGKEKANVVALIVERLRITIED